MRRGSWRDAAALASHLEHEERRLARWGARRERWLLDFARVLFPLR